MKIREAIGNKKGIAYSYSNIGNVYNIQGNYPEALKNLLVSLKIREAIGNKKGIADSYNNIGLVYYYQGNYTEALKNHFSSLKIYEALSDKKDIASSYNNIGIVYSDQGNYTEALKNYLACLKIMEAIDNKSGIATSYNNIGLVYFDQGNYPEALKNYFSSLKIKEAIGDKAGIAISYNTIGNVFIKQKKYKEAGEYLIKAKELSKEIGYKEYLRNAYSHLTELDSAKGNYKGAYENHKLYIFYRDSLDNEQTRKKIIQNQMTYDFEKKEAVANAEYKKEIENQQALAEEKSRKQNVVTLFVVIGLLLVLVFAGFILRSLRVTRKQKQIIEIKSRVTEQQKIIIEEKNKDITDSINYAKRIQEAKLPKKDEIYSSLPQSFVLFKPKDIVSGDFYFFQKNDKCVFIAAADCTGHGVPGAFMSIIGSEKLEYAISQSTDTSEILKQLNKGIKTSLRQSDSNESTRDGMDLAICYIDTENHIVKYAGANRPIWIIRKNQTDIEEIKATKTAIGGLTDDNQYFDTHELKLQQDDTFYIFSDGYADTFSEQNGKKLTTKKFKQILIDIQAMTMQEQEIHLNNFIEDWKTGTEQIDDILVISVRL